MPVASSTGSNVDDATYGGPIGATDQMFTTYSADARGYGVHSRYVGSASQTLVNNTGLDVVGLGVRVPFGQGNLDLLGGAVKQLNLSSGLAAGDASALSPSDQSDQSQNATNIQYGNCTDSQTVLGQCLPLTVPNPTPTPTPTATPSAPNTRQAWPFPEAACVAPAAPGRGAAERQHIRLLRDKWQ